MAEFEVKTERLDNISSKINSHGNTVHGLVSSVENVRNNCAIESEAKLIIIMKLQSIIEEMEREAVSIKSLGNSLQQISQVYRTTEQSIVGHKSVTDITPEELADIIKDIIEDRTHWDLPTTPWKKLLDIIGGFAKPTFINFSNTFDGALDAIDKLPDEIKKLLPEEVLDVLDVISDIESGDADLDTLEKIVELFVEDEDKVNVIKKLRDIWSNDNIRMWFEAEDRLMKSAMEKSMNGDKAGFIKDWGIGTLIGLYGIFYGGYEVATEIAADAVQTTINEISNVVDECIPGDFGDRCADIIESGGDWLVKKIRAIF